jgi:hypothetical protein
MVSTNSSTDRTEREEVLALLAETIEATHERIDDFEATSADEQELLIKWIRALGYLTGQYRKLLKDEDLDELRETADLLEAADRRREDS